ncbi:MAG: hypothetical protein IJU29_00690 [Oscillospiraceae bacterium]|nr:hypothetical protein [Oscillospiraceae bacterium]
MNRIQRALTALLLGCMCLLTACGGADAPASTAAVDETAAPAVSAVPAAPAQEQGSAAVQADYGPLRFTYGGVTFGIYDKAGPVLDALGEPADTFTADSCAYQGSDYFYYYDGIELCVNDIDGERYITGITLADDTVQMPQGVCIGMDIAEALEKLGMEYTQSGAVYSFVSGSALLHLRTGDDGSVTAIQYIPA